MSLFQKLLEKMKIVKKLNALKALREERGAIFVLTALLLPVLFGFLGLGYDVGNLYVHKAKLQNTADAAALAGGREYVNSLKGANNQLTIEIPDDNKKAAAKTALTGGATRYISENNPVFASSGDAKYFIGVENHHTDSQDPNIVTGNTEYFRVNLTEPVRVYFMPVLGIKNSASVSVYATTKLSDTVLGNGSGNSFNDESYKPVMILGNNFNDRDNTNDPGHVNIYYDSGTVYAVNGALIVEGTMGQPRLDDDGDPAVPSHNGTSTMTLERGNERIQIGAAKIIQIDYDMERLGREVRKLFIDEYIKSLNLSPEDKGIKEGQRDNFINALKDRAEAKRIWDQHYEEGKQQYRITYKIQQANEIYKQLEKYRLVYKNALNTIGQGWQTEVAVAATMSEWNSEENKTISDQAFEQILREKIWNSGNPWVKKPSEDNWHDSNYNSNDSSWKEYERFGITDPGVSLSDYMVQYMSQYTDPGSEPKASEYGLQYYMTYVGERKDPFKTSEISSSTALSGPKHSYFYLSWNTAGYNAPQTEIEVDGFYVNAEEGITENTPFYLFVDSDIDLTKVHITKFASGDNIGNRPLVLCYMGPQGTAYNFDNKANAGGDIVLKGIIYAPRAHTAANTSIPLVNFNQQTFEGSFVSTTMDMENGVNLTYVDGKTEWGMTFTQNIGFDVSGNGSGSGGNEQSSFTLPERLKLWLEGKNKTDSYYKDEDITWQSL